MAPPLPSEGESYKTRIEALRLDFGSSWLGALAADEGWDAAAVVTAAAAGRPRLEVHPEPVGSADMRRVTGPCVRR